MQISLDGGSIISHILVATFAVAASAAASRYRRKDSKTSDPVVDSRIIPLFDRTESGRLGKLERFSHYIARQLGLEDPNEYPQLLKLADDYLRKSKGCEDNIFAYFSDEPEAESLYVKLIEELEKFTLSYFAFHWTHAPTMVTQALSAEHETKPKLKNLVMAATRKLRFEKVTKNLSVTRVFCTLVEEMKAIETKDVMVPAALSKRSPVLLLMGGGMGAGKSTVLKDIMKEPFWLEAESNAVVVEADAFKETDVIYRALSSHGHHDDMLQTAELVHQSSTDAASSLLVTALNEGRDVIMDGTLSWEPFVEQTIVMARNVHKCRYRMGVGYKVNEDGTVIENYWEEDEDQEKPPPHRKPYRIEIVGVICDAYLAVVRGIRYKRAVMVKRAVRVNSQLTSHKRFAVAFPKYCELVDNSRLYCTNALGGPPRLIAWKGGDNKLLIEPEEIKCLKNLSKLKPKADSIYELYSDPSPIFEAESVWHDVVMSPERAAVQKELKSAIQKIEQN